MKKLLLTVLLALGLAACCATAPQVEVVEDKPITVWATEGAPRPVAQIVFDRVVDSKGVDALELALNTVPASTEIIVLVIDSPGGLLNEGRRAARLIENQTRPVFCIVDGLGASAAYYLFQSCPVRMMTTRSTLLIHEAFREFSGDKETVLQQMADLELTNAMMSVQQCQRLRIPFEACREAYRGKDWFLPPVEAEAVGAVDFVVMTPKEVVVSLAYPEG